MYSDIQGRSAGCSWLASLWCHVGKGLVFTQRGRCCHQSWRLGVPVARYSLVRWRRSRGRGVWPLGLLPSAPTPAKSGRKPVRRYYRHTGTCSYGVLPYSVSVFPLSPRWYRWKGRNAVIGGIWVLPGFRKNGMFQSRNAQHGYRQGCSGVSPYCVNVLRQGAVAA